MPRLSSLARNLKAESAFTVLAAARSLRAKGKDVVELEIGDSPFPTTPNAKQAGIKAIEDNETGYCPSLGLPSFRAAAARFVSREFGYSVTAENIVVGSGAKPFEQYFAEVVLEPGDGVLVFSPQFPTYIPNLERRGARAVLAPLQVEHGFRPSADAVRRFPRAIRGRGESFSTRLTTLPEAWPLAPTWRRSPTLCAAASSWFSRMSPIAIWSGTDNTRRSWPSRACSSTWWRIHVQQVVQHERLADWLCRGSPRVRRCDRKTDQHVGLVHAPLAQRAAEAALEARRQHT